MLFLCLSVLDIMDSGDPHVCLCCCLSIRLSELLSINVGLFDQYFRVVGQWIYLHLDFSIYRGYTNVNTELLTNAYIVVYNPPLYSWILSLSLFAGHSADHIVCCLSRDSYGTSIFLQELMSALSLQQQLPPPEPSDQDFYSQFTNTNTGNPAQSPSLRKCIIFLTSNPTLKCRD